MSTLIAKPIVKNKFWIVEESGEKIATIQALENSNKVAFVHGNSREVFPSIKLLSDRYNIRIFKPERKKSEQISEIYGLPVKHKPHNVVFNIKKNLVLFTKSGKSKSFYCAGYYRILINYEWTTQFCPKLIILNRNQYLGPFRSLAEAEADHG